MWGVYFYGIGGLDGVKRGGERDLVVSIVGTVTSGCYEWIIISCLCTYVKVGYYSYAKDVIISIISNIGVNIFKTSML